MSERIFLDTNILVYLFDYDSPVKQRLAREILEKYGPTGSLLLSTQVLQEFYVTVTKKLAVPLAVEAAAQAVSDLAALPLIPIDSALILSAIRRSHMARLSFWDALIIEAALAGKATDLYSEDLQHHQQFDGLRIVNPFLSATST
jgi:predicted nucleic acid-binding protein